MLKSKTAWAKKSPFMIYADLEKFLVPENKEKQNPEEFYASKYQNNDSWGFDYN